MQSIAPDYSIPSGKGSGKGSGEGSGEQNILESYCERTAQGINGMFGASIKNLPVHR